MKAILIDNCNNCPHATRHYVVKPYKGYEIQCEMACTKNGLIKVVGMSDQIETTPIWCPLQDMEDMGCTDEGITIEKAPYKFSISGRTWEATMPKFIWKDK